jgi:hypothetical protein
MAHIYTLNTLPANALRGYALTQTDLEDEAISKIHGNQILIKRHSCINQVSYDVFECNDKAHLHYLRLLANWMILDIRGVTTPFEANQLLMPFQGGYCSIEWFISNVINPTIRGNGLVAEAWEYEFSVKIHDTAERLPCLLKKPLLVASGCLDDDLVALSIDAADAVSEARLELYGYQ